MKHRLFFLMLAALILPGWCLKLDLRCLPGL